MKKSVEEIGGKIVKIFVEISVEEINGKIGGQIGEKILVPLPFQKYSKCLLKQFLCICLFVYLCICICVFARQTLRNIVLVP